MILVLILLILVTACTVATLPPASSKDFKSLIEPPEMTFATFADARKWIAVNITYKMPDPYVWQTPKTTMELKTGMCVDRSLALLWYADLFGYTTLLRVVKLDNGLYHAICVINGIEIDAQIYSTSKPEYASWCYDLTLDECLERCYYKYHARNTWEVLDECGKNN